MFAKGFLFFAPSSLPAMVPGEGDKILVMKPNWLRRIFTDKTMEVRGANLSHGYYFLGCHGKIWARVCLDEGMPIKTDEEWVALQGEHRVATDSLPYKRTFGFRILSLEKLRRPVPYFHPLVAIWIVRYRRL